MKCCCIGCFREKNLDNGLRVLHDDNVCRLMSDWVTGNNVADVFVESMAMQFEAFADDERSDGEENEIAAEIEDREIIGVDDGSFDEVQFIGEKKTASIQGNQINLEESSMPSIQLQKCSNEMGEEQGKDSSLDSDYHLPT